MLCHALTLRSDSLQAYSTDTPSQAIDVVEFDISGVTKAQPKVSFWIEVRNVVKSPEFLSVAKKALIIFLLLIMLGMKFSQDVPDVDRFNDSFCGPCG